MSDVPVTAWWLLVATLACSGLRGAALGSGLAASAALLTRPNLLPMAVVIGVWFLGKPRRSRLASAAWFAVGAVPGCLAVAAINAWLYGSPVESGYGRVDTIFAADRLLTNLSRYPSWMLETQTPFIFLGLAAPWITWRLSKGAEAAHSRSLARQWLLLVLSAVLFACYAFYLPFDNWTFLRFLMPSIPWLLILSAIAARAMISRASLRWQPLLTMGVFAIVAATCWDIAAGRHVFAMREDERRFQRVAAFVKESLPENAAVLSRLHSGSIRQYAGRLTVRWDSLPPEWLDRALVFLRERRYHPYLVIEDSEVPEYRARFAGRHDLPLLDQQSGSSPGGPSRVQILDLTASTRVVEIAAR